MNRASPHHRALSGLTLAAQFAVVAGGLLLVETTARRDGAELLVPIGAAARAAMPALALDGDSRLIGAGVFPGSLVIRRERPARHSLLAHGILSIAVPLGLCGDGATA